MLALIKKSMNSDINKLSWAVHSSFPENGTARTGFFGRTRRHEVNLRANICCCFSLVVWECCQFFVDVPQLASYLSSSLDEPLILISLSIEYNLIAEVYLTHSQRKGILVALQLLLGSPSCHSNQLMVLGANYHKWAIASLIFVVLQSSVLNSRGTVEG